MIFVDLHARHWRWSLVERDDSTEAEITIPGTRTNLFIQFAVRSRNWRMLSPDLSVNCIFVIDCKVASTPPAVVPARGKRMVRAAFVAAFSNCAGVSVDVRCRIIALVTYEGQNFSRLVLDCMRQLIIV